MTEPTSPAKKGRTTTSERRVLARGTQHANALLREAPRNEALLYLRVSSDDSAENNLSIPDQKKKLLKWCDENGKIPRKTYVDEGISAYLDVRRRQYDQMVEDIRGGLFPQVGYVLIYATSRLFRKARKYGNLEEELNSLGIEVVSVTQTFAKDAGGYVSKQGFDHVRRISFHRDFSECKARPTRDDRAGILARWPRSAWLPPRS